MRVGGAVAVMVRLMESQPREIPPRSLWTILLSILTDVSGTAPGGVYVDQDIIEAIRQDHEEILKVLGDLEVHERANSETYSVARGLLYSHMYGEEVTIYERMRSEMNERIEDSLAEHNSIRVGLDRLDRIEITGTEWAPAIQDLKRRVQFHIDSEERLLKAAESFLDKSERFEIAERFRRAQGEQSGYTLA